MLFFVFHFFPSFVETISASATSSSTFAFAEFCVYSLSGLSFSPFSLSLTPVISYSPYTQNVRAKLGILTIKTLECIVVPVGTEFDVWRAPNWSTYWRLNQVVAGLSPAHFSTPPSFPSKTLKWRKVGAMIVQHTSTSSSLPIYQPSSAKSCATLLYTSHFCSSWRMWFIISGSKLNAFLSSSLASGVPPTLSISNDYVIIIIDWQILRLVLAVGRVPGSRPRLKLWSAPLAP